MDEFNPGDTDVSLSTLSSGQVLQYNGTKWINSTLIMGSTALASDSDVSLSGLSNGELLQYNSSTTKWNNYTPTYTSSCSIQKSTDGSITSPSANQLLMYNGSKWTNNTMSLEQNNDVSVSSLTNKNILIWNGTNWINIADLTNDEANIATLQVSTGILVNTTNTAQNTTIVTSFSDSSSGNPIMHGNATSPSIITPTAAFLYPVDNITIYS